MDFEALTQRYRDSLPEKFSALMSAWENWVSNPDEVNCEREFRGLIHRIAGSAGAFGYASLGERARAIDDKMLRFQDSSVDGSNPVQAELDLVQGFVVEFFEHFTAQMQRDHES